MGSNKMNLEFVLEQLSLLDDISYKMMMGEYLIYYKGKLLSYICDNRFLVKITKSSLELIDNPKFEAPYDGAKNMILVDNLDNKEFLFKLFNKMYDELPFTKKK